MKFYPSRAQWAVVWGIALAALWMWIDGGPYPVPLAETHDRRIIALVITGALVVWMLSDMEKLREVVAWYDPRHRKVAGALGLFLVLFVAYLIGLIGQAPQRSTGW